LQFCVVSYKKKEGINWFFMKNILYKKEFKWLIIIGALILFWYLFTIFPIIKFNDKIIFLFAPEKIVDRKSYMGRILGNILIKTEFGEIKLEHFSNVYVMYNNLARVDIEIFNSGLASHNLIVKEIIMPDTISIGFLSNPNRISILALDGQEIDISDILLGIGKIYLEDTKDVTEIIIEHSPEFITLIDQTQIHIGQSLRSLAGCLHIFSNKEQWMLTHGYGILVKLPGETKFTRYKSITFKKDWGEFIEGELFEE